MQRIDFFRLERPIQERFVASAHGAAQPLPIAVAPEPLPRSVVAWSAAAILSLVALIGFARVGYGDLDSAFALQPIGVIALYAALGGFVAFCARRARAVLLARRSLPYAPGVYVFPAGLIDTRGPEFVVRGLRELTSAGAKDRSLWLAFEDGSRFTFTLPTPQHAAEAERAVKEYRERLAPGLLPLSGRELAMLDPLCDNGFKNPFSPTESMRPPAPKRFPVWAIGAIAAGAALGIGLFAVRNVLAERALYREARRVDTRAGYLAYQARGGKQPEVAQILLPRTELAEVMQGGSLEALEQFAATHRGSPIAPEIENALHHALRRALDAARAKGTITELKKFQEGHGKHPKIAPEVESAIDEHWKARLAAFEQSARPRPAVRDFFRRLLAYTSKHGSRVDVRFRRRIPESVPRAEAMISKSLYFGGPESLPAQYFDPARSGAREEPVGKELVSALSQAFPADLVEFRLAPAMDDSPEDLPPVQVPTLLITHRTEMSGGYLLKRPRAALTGIGVLFRVTFQIPGDQNALLFKLSTWNAPDLDQAAKEFKGFDDIYDEMAVRAFSKLPKKYLADLLPGLGT